MNQFDNLFDDPAILLQILDDIEAYIFIKDLRGHYQYVNRHVCELFGSYRETILGKDDSAYFALEHADDLRRHDQQVLEQGITVKQEERSIIRATGETRYYWTVKQPLYDNQGNLIGMYGISVDTTEMARLRNKLARQAQSDELTQLANRRHFLTLLEQVVAESNRYGTPCSIISFDLDDFKAINDTYGHHAGDEVLSSIADLIRHTIRQSDIAGRLGGDEFCILLPHTREKGASELAQRLCVAVSTLEVVGRWPGTIRPGISTGIATFKAGDRVDDLLHRADIRLYEAKKD